MSHYSSFALPMMVVVVAAVGCGSDPAGGGGSTVAIGQATPSGNAQTALVASVLPNPLRVVVTQDGVPFAGRTIAWSTASGSITSSSNTDASGIATAQWTLGQVAGAQSASATLSGAGGSPVGFSATATAGPATSIAKAGGDNQSGIVNTQLPNPLIAMTADQFGNPVSGVGVDWQVTSGTATVAPPSSSTGSNGQAQTVVTLGGTSGTIVIEAASTGLSGSPLSYTATAMTLPTAVTVQVVDSDFQPNSITIASGGTVTWNWAATTVLTHNVSPDGTQPTRSGNPTAGPNGYQFTFNTPGTYRYYCEVHGAPGGIGMSGTVTVM